MENGPVDLIGLPVPTLTVFLPVGRSHNVTVDWPSMYCQFISEDDVNSASIISLDLVGTSLYITCCHSLIEVFLISETLSDLRQYHVELPLSSNPQNRLQNLQFSAAHRIIITESLSRKCISSSRNMTCTVIHERIHHSNSFRSYQFLSYLSCLSNRRKH